jgi:hypothetical protein
MIARYVQRGFVLLMMLGVVLTGAVPAAAQPIVPPIPACDGASRSADEIAALQADSATSVAADELERTGEASAEDAEAIAQTLAAFFACIAAEDEGRAAAFLTDAAIADGLFSLTGDDESDPSTGIEFLGLYGAWTLSDGRIAALFAADDDSLHYPVISAVLIFTNVDGQWLIDDVSF